MLGFIFSTIYFFIWLGAWIFGLISAAQIIVALAKMINRNFIRVPHNLAERYGKDSWAIVTGATGGLGYEFCRQLAKAGLNIVLMSRRQGELIRVEAELKQEFPYVKTRVVQADFALSSEPGFFKDIEKELSDLDISILVNNAGLLFWEKFEDFDPQQLHDQININSTSYAMMTHTFINRFLERKQRSGIINVASLASYCPTSHQGSLVQLRD